jgi:hypothetical protein
MSDIFDQQQRRENIWTQPLDRVMENQNRIDEREEGFQKKNAQGLGAYLDFINLKENKYNNRFMTNQALFNLETAQEYGLLDEDELYKQATSLGLAQQYGIDPEYVRANLESFLLAEDIDPSKKVPRDWFNGFVARARTGANSLVIGIGATQLMKMERPGLKSEGELRGALALRNNLDEISKLNETLAFGDESLAKNPIVRFLQNDVVGNFLESAPYSAYVMGAAAIGNAILPGAGGKIGSFLAGAQVAIGQEYYQLTNLKDENGKPLLDREIARNAALTLGPILSLIETAIWDSAAHLGGAVGKAMGKEMSSSFTQRIAANVLTNLHAKGFLYRIGQMGMEGLFRGFGEGGEEFLQQITEEVGQNIALELQKNKVLETFGGTPEERDALIRQLQDAKTKPGDIFHNALEAFKGGAAATLLSGLPETVINYHNSGVEVRKLNSMYRSIDSEEAAIKATEESPVFAGMTPEQRLKTQKEMYKNVRSKRDAEEARIAAELKAQGGQLAGLEERQVNEAGEDVTGEAKRLPNGKIYTRIENEKREGGVVTGSFRMGDWTQATESNSYGAIDYRIENGVLTITNVNIASHRRELTDEFFQDFTKKFADADIQWNPETEADIALKEQLVANNRRGPEAGLNWFEPEAVRGESLETQQAKQNFDRQLAAALPRSPAESRQGAVSLLDRIGKGYGLEFEEFLDRLGFDRGNIFTNTPNQEVIDFNDRAAQYAKDPEAAAARGAMFKVLKKLDDDVKAVEYTVVYLDPKSADFSTVIHELKHAVDNFLEQADPELYRRMMDAAGAYDPAAAKGMDEKTWRKERSAYAFENYLQTGEAPTPELRSLFRQMAEWLKDIVNHLSGLRKLTPEQKAAFDELLTRADSFEAESAETAQNGPNGLETNRDEKRRRTRCRGIYDALGGFWRGGRGCKFCKFRARTIRPFKRRMGYARYSGNPGVL